MTLKQFIRDAMFSIAFFQIILTPYLFFFLGLTMDQYGRWCLANMFLSAIMGPLFAAAYRFLFTSARKTDTVG